MKISIANSVIIKQIKSIYTSALKATSPNMIALWESASDHDGGYLETLITNPLQNIRKNAQMYYWTVTNSGLSAQLHAKYLHNITSEIETLEETRLDHPLDPMASNSMQDLKLALSNIVPVSVPAPIKNKEVKPEQKSMQSGEGFTYRKQQQTQKPIQVSPSYRLPIPQEKKPNPFEQEEKHYIDYFGETFKDS